jgi:hypothetical protein
MIHLEGKSTTLGRRACRGAPAAVCRFWIAFMLTFLVSYTPLGAAEPAPVRPWVSLFNGKDLSGWLPMNDGVFSATNGTIHLAKGMGWLRTERPYTNFIFEAEWRALQTNYNSGFFLHAGLDGKPFPTDVWQVNLKETALGSLLKGAKTIVPSTTAAVPVNQWFKFRMELSGHKLVLTVNGERTWEYDNLDAGPGFIGLQAEGKAFDFRNLRLQELP